MTSSLVRTSRKLVLAFLMLSAPSPALLVQASCNSVVGFKQAFFKCSISVKNCSSKFIEIPVCVDMCMKCSPVVGALEDLSC